MASDPDPYRTLGLPRTASLAEVKRAYRRLAKSNHPDAAGEVALPRFLAIQAAYDQIVDDGAGTPGMARPRRPWDADPSRADATRRAYGGRSRRGRPSDPRPPGSGRSGASASGTTGRPTGGSTTGPGPTAGGGGTRAGRPPNKATLGSTSYDGADAEPFEPDWGGASWYGTTSGTYWTLNPKEYADPRKHGPEYQARARRAAAAGGGPAAADGGSAATAAAADGGPAATVDAAPPGPAAAHTTSSWWEATTTETATETAAPPAADPPGAAARPSWSGVPPAPPRPSAEAGPGTPSAGPGTGLLTPWLDPGATGLPIRVGRAVAGWVPVALGISWLAGEVSGCGRFAATCDPASTPVAWAVQLVVLAVLLLVPRLAVATFLATLAVVAAAVPAALILTATGRSSIGGEAQVAPTAGPPVLGGILVIAWLAGLGAGTVRELRRIGVLDGTDAPRPGAPGGPVS